MGIDATESLRRLQVKLVVVGVVNVLAGLTFGALGWILASMVAGLLFLCALLAIFVVGVVAWRRRA